MAREDPQIKLRLTEELRDAIREEAENNGRSMNAEIVYRLENSLDPDYFGSEVAHLRQIYEQSTTRDNTFMLMAAAKHVLYVALDSNGFPISWPEVMTHLNAIAALIEDPIEKIEAAVITPEVVSSDRREDAWFELVNYYRSRRKAPD